MNENEAADWRITATTIRCDLVNESVTIMVNGDWSYDCAWYRKNKSRPGNCAGPDCPIVIGYRDKLIVENKTAGEK
jgi:hypothetical protein